MAADPVREPTIQFDVFELDQRNSQFRRNGLPVDLPPQALKILSLLASRPNQLVTRGDIKDALWPGEGHGDFDSRLNVTVRELREALGDDAERPRYVQTVRKAGYRFIAPVRTAPVASAGAVSLLEETGSPYAPTSPTLVPPRREPVRHSVLAPLLIGFVLGLAAYALTQRVVNLHRRPIIKGVSAITAEQTQQIRINGERLGNYAQFHALGLDTPFLAIDDDTAGWGAGRIVPNNVDEVTLVVSDWTESLITIDGFSGRYGNGPLNEGNWKLRPGDKVRVRVWNPQTGVEADDCVVTVGRGDTACSK